MSILYATGGRGTEYFIENELNDLTEVHSVSAIDGKVFFTSTAPAHKLKQLKSVERLFSCILQDKDFTFQGHKDLNKLHTLVQSSSENFGTAYEVWQEFRDERYEAKRSKLDVVHFRVSCKCMGKYKHLVQDIAKTIGAAVSHTLGWAVNLRNPEVEICCQINNDGLTMGIPLTRLPLSQRTYLSFPGLRSTVSWIMAKLANIQPYGVVVDPMCGCSTILVEAAKSWPHAQYIGLDIAKDQLGKSLRNFHTAQVSIHVVQADSTALPLPSNSVDSIVCDLPFGVQHLTVEKVKDLYPKALAEMHRVLKLGGKAVLLTSQELLTLLLECAALKTGGIMGKETTKQGGSMQNIERTTMDKAHINPQSKSHVQVDKDKGVVKQKPVHTGEQLENWINPPNQDKQEKRLEENDKKLVENEKEVSQNLAQEELCTSVIKQNEVHLEQDDITVKDNIKLEEKGVTGDVMGQTVEDCLLWKVQYKHYLKLGETHAYVCVLNKI